MQTVIALLKHFAGDRIAIDSATREELKSRGLLSEIDGLIGSYTHHYPICVRRVLPDDTFISMTGGMDEPSYAISFISYARPPQRSSFFAFAASLSKTLASMFDGRPHWGKICPLSSDNVDRLYPQFAQFCKICTIFDPDRAFTSHWMERLAMAKGSGN